MPRTTKTITFSLPPEMADRVDEVMKQQGRSRSEFLREAVLRYIEECEWRQLLQYGEERAREKGIGPEDVAGLWKSTGPRSVPPVHESRPRHQRHSLRSELPRKRAPRSRTGSQVAV